MNFRHILVLNRIPIAILLFALGFLIGFKLTWWVAWIPMLIAILMVVAHFMIGPMTLIQGYIENGDMDGAQKMLEKITKPEWLYKPLRSSYYMLQGNLSTMSEDLDKAESNIRKSIDAGFPEKQYEGTAYLQLGAINLKKGQMKEAMENLKMAVKIGLPDGDNEATAYLQLCQISIQRRDFRNAKLYFNKAKAAKPKNTQIVEQIKEIAKYIARIPG